MAILPIAKLGNPVLRKPAEPVSVEELRGKEFQQFIDDVLATMYQAEGIGLAAPQVARSQQLVVMACPEHNGFPETVLVNPKIVFYGSRMSENWEGCLSVEGLRGKVTRPAQVRVHACDRKGAALDFEASGLYAVCIQHEMDHLIGKVFLDRMTDLASLTHLEEFQQFWQKDPANVI